MRAKQLGRQNVFKVTVEQVQGILLPSQDSILLKSSETSHSENGLRKDTR